MQTARRAFRSSQQQVSLDRCRLRQTLLTPLTVVATGWLPERRPACSAFVQPVCYKKPNPSQALRKPASFYTFEGGGWHHGKSERFNLTGNRFELRPAVRPLKV
jgi:hypothetical protein